MNKTVSPERRVKTSPKYKKQTIALDSQAATEATWSKRVEALLVHRSWLLFALLVAIGSARIVATYHVFSYTIDEPVHLACGLEWLSKGRYTYEAQHPPLARVMTALPPYLFGARTIGKPNVREEAAAVLLAGGHYNRTLTLARFGILPFFWLASLVVYFWTKRIFGEVAAFFATFLFTFLPPILAHASVATTDMALTATLGAAFLTMLIWARTPTWQCSLLFGISLGLAVLSKFSTLAFFPSAVILALIAYLAIERPTRAFVASFIKTRVLPFVLAMVAAMLFVWAGYRFSFNKIPAPELFQGIQQVEQHNANGHQAYLLGKVSHSGWWYYYFVDLAVKTPLPLLGLLGVGLVVCWKNRREAGRRYWIAAAFSLGVLLFAAFFSKINIGIRHVLPIYIGFSMIAAVGALHLWRAKSAAVRFVFAALMLWMAATSIWSHPDYLPYFNALAGDEPEKIVVDSDLDWGQDLKRLEARLDELGVTRPTIQVLGFITRPLNPELPAPGWNAVSMTLLKSYRMGLGDDSPDYTPWPERMQPVERVGKSILLFYFPPKK